VCTQRDDACLYGDMHATPKSTVRVIRCCTVADVVALLLSLVILQDERDRERRIQRERNDLQNQLKQENVDRMARIQVSIHNRHYGYIVTAYTRCVQAVASTAVVMPACMYHVPLLHTGSVLVALELAVMLQCLHWCALLRFQQSAEHRATVSIGTKLHCVYCYMQHALLTLYHIPKHCTTHDHNTTTTITTAQLLLTGVPQARDAAQDSRG
jgi:hypothetical protein